MNKKVFDIVVKSCEELGTLQQDGTVFLDAEAIKKCKTINQDVSLQGLEEEYRIKTFTTKREEYVKEKMKIYNDFKKQLASIQEKFRESINELAEKTTDIETYNAEKTKYTQNKQDLLKELRDEIVNIRDDIASRYYKVEQVQYKDLVNRMFRIQSLDDEKKEFQLNLDTTEQQLINLIDKRRKVDRKYKLSLTVFLILSSIFLALFIYYLFSKNTL